MKSAIRFLSLLLIFLGLFGCNNGDEPNPQPQKEIEAGTGTFTFTAYTPLADKPIPVRYFAPEGSLETAEILIVMHGTGRNGSGYRNDWMGPLRDKNVLIIVPEFPSPTYPGSRSYNLGNMYNENDELNPEEIWTFSMIEPLFDYVKSIVDSEQEQYYLYGHSAGAQFVHRFAFYKSDNRAKVMISANAGWYVIPDFNISYPYGLHSAPVDGTSLGNSFGKRLIVLLGEEDNDPNDANLRKTEEAEAQGPHRFARGNFFFEASGMAADSLQTTFNWERITVPGVGHSNLGMAPHAAKILFD